MVYAEEAYLLGVYGWYEDTGDALTEALLVVLGEASDEISGDIGSGRSVGASTVPTRGPAMLLLPSGLEMRYLLWPACCAVSVPEMPRPPDSGGDCMLTGLESASGNLAKWPGEYSSIGDL